MRPLHESLRFPKNQNPPHPPHNVQSCQRYHQAVPVRKKIIRGEGILPKEKSSEEGRNANKITKPFLKARVLTTYRRRKREADTNSRGAEREKKRRRGS